MILRLLVCARAIVVLAWCAVGHQAQASDKELLLIVQGPDGHPPATHEYAAGARVLKHCLANVEGLRIRTVLADGPWTEGPEMIAEADGVVMFLAQGARWVQQAPRRQEALVRLAHRGGGIVALHWAIGTKDPKYIPAFLELLGGCHGGPDRRFKIVTREAIVAATDHPIARGLSDFRARDEFYYRLKFVHGETGIVPIIKVAVEDDPETVAWAWDRTDGGRSFGFSGLHFHDNWQLEGYRRLVAQGTLWTLSVPIPLQGLEVDVPAGVLALPAATR